MKFFFMDLLGCCGFCVGIESLNSHDFPLIIFVHKIVISEIFVVYKIYSNNVHTILHVCLDCIENGRHARLRFFVWVPCIVYETLSMDFNKFFFNPTVLFTHLKIILLQYFQFSAIRGIQTDSTYILSTFLTLQ